VYGHWKKTDRFMRESFPHAWMTSCAGDEVVYGLPPEDVERILATARVEPACLDATVIGIAGHIREKCQFDALAILADALQEGGCENEEILKHCRARAPHEQTCWVVDLLLGPKRTMRRNARLY
jgi:hypothetical protein